MMNKAQQSFQQKTFLFGATLALIPGVLWGLSGVFGQHLFQHYDINAEWLVTVRLLVSGILMICWSFWCIGKDTLTVFSNKQDLLKLLISTSPIVTIP